MEQERHTLNRLAALMRAFDMHGKDLSKVIHVDESLVSKWKSGKRQLKPGSNYVDSIASYFLSVDKSNKYVRIRKLLADSYEDIMRKSGDELLAYLKAWLTENGAGPEHDLYDELRGSGFATTSVSYCFKGDVGRRRAVDFMNRYVMGCQPPLEIICFTTEDGRWFREDEEFYRHWLELQLALIEKGHIIQLIQPVNRTYEETADSIVRWLPLHMTGKVIDSYIPDYVVDSIRYTQFVVPGHLAIWGFSSANYTRQMNTWLTTDKDTLENCENIIHEYLNKAMPLFERFYFDMKARYINELTGMMQRRSQKYFHGSVTLYMPMSREIMSDVLKSNGISEKNIGKAMDTYDMVSSLNAGERCRYILNTETLRQLMSGESVDLLPLSFILGERVRADRESFRRIIREFADLVLDNDLTEIAILDEDRKDEFEGINVFAQEGNKIHFMSTKSDNPFVLSVKEATVVVAVIERIKNLWNSIPGRMKEKEYAVSRILEIAESER
jgi:transcriptional regulator with XRE-family HTH domain